jgi:hypothetical protein
LHQMTQCRPQCNDRHPPGIPVGHHCHPATWTDSKIPSWSLTSVTWSQTYHVWGFIQVSFRKSKKEATQNNWCHCVEMLQADPRGTSGLCEVRTEESWDEKLTLHVLWPLVVWTQRFVDVTVLP